MARQRVRGCAPPVNSTLKWLLCGTKHIMKVMRGMKNKLALGCIAFLITQTDFAQLSLREAVINRIPPSQSFQSDGTAGGRLWEGSSEARPVAQQVSFLIRNPTLGQEEGLVPPILLKREALQAGNLLATYAAILDL